MKMKKLLISILITAFFTTNNHASLWDEEDMRKRNLEPTISLYCPNSHKGIVLFDHLEKNVWDQKQFLGFNNLSVFQLLPSWKKRKIVFPAPLYSRRS